MRRKGTDGVARCTADLVQSAHDPGLGQLEPSQAVMGGKADGAEACPLGLGDVLQVQEHEFGGVPELVGEVAVGGHSVQGQIQVLAGCRTWK